MKRTLLILWAVVLISLIVVVSTKLSNDAIAVIIGVGLGVLASVPTSLLIAFVLTRQNRQVPQPPPGLTNNQAQPPVVIVNGGQQPGLKAGQPPAYQVQPPSTRTFTIVGEESTEV